MSNIALSADEPLEKWLSYLENSHTKAIDLGLARVKAVASDLDLLNPAPFVITVAGTNGKGTTCRLLERFLLNAGLRVGVYSSPHLIHYNERVRIQNAVLPDEIHTQSFAFIEQHKRQSLTYFEFSTLSALHLFKQAKLDVVILEVGLGGRLDATNIIDSDIAVITSIDIDHVEFLGSERHQIGLEKAGIFRAGKPAIIGEPDIPESVLEHGKALNCQLFCRKQDWHFIQRENSWDWLSEKVQLKNLPFCNIPLPNAATALAVLAYLPFNISNAVIHRSLQDVELTGRFQRLKSEDLAPLAAKLQINKLPQIIIDVGHNPHAAHYLAQKLTALKAQEQRKMIAVCGILKDKDIAGILSPLLPVFEQWYCVTLSGNRGQTGEVLAQQLRALSDNVTIKPTSSVANAIKSAVENTSENDIVVVFGSFHTVGEFLQFIASQ
ncbi:bifunctional tetrahydrofolate synthase/dihydrofolate synthase [Conservatibacter flavescens]|uniref:Dihydrofolate synthase/folylpolyglutamate synthase n=1 Tax=Conservatibacter flavescens TaxID=28161 RepID=A0A2M8S5S3_9PAST|nr:bifunctional tetrahydrofolate synthase/dihydrofolate synthase [Conservatibacter flavescens]PJG86458.1 bifunctional tetrahydrofolate synthase/dihydrofolate synthase [Conservatibacter flavescens]